MGARQRPDPLNDSLRGLPAVERLAATVSRQENGPVPPDRLTVAIARETVAARREQLTGAGAGAGAGASSGQLAGAGAEADDAGADDLVAEARRRLALARADSLRRVINATGVIVHTNLGRSPLAAAAQAAVARAAAGYSNLELDLRTGERGSRQAHVAGLARELTGAQGALVVNNGAGAVLLAAAALAGAARSLIVSRGQLIEIGGSFRIPDVVAASGARLVEVGTTNRTRIEDYVRAIDAERARGHEVGAVLRAHPSNFRAMGFVEDVSIEALCELGVAVIDDIGSGVLEAPASAGLSASALAEEPPARRSVQAGAALVCFSGDKLLGGPQAGLMVGAAEAIGRAAAHPLARALRIDKLSLAALEATLKLHREPERARREVPVLAMLDAAPEVLARRAERLRSGLGCAGIPAEVIGAVARVGGGALPLLELEGPAVSVAPGPDGADALARSLRGGEPAVVARIARGRLLLDPRTLGDGELDDVLRAVVGALTR